MQDPKLKVMVPATSANLGPGFDSLGIALDLWNTVQASISLSPIVNISGEGTETLSRSEDNLVYQSAQMAFREAGESPPNLSLYCNNRIPLARGLGSSAAGIIGGLLAGNALCRRPLPIEDIFQIAANMEGHADNVAPAIFGGCQIVIKDKNRFISTPIIIPTSLKAVVFIPDVAMPTTEAREILSPQISREDAVFNIGRVALLVNALSNGRLDDLIRATEDRLHQPAREQIFPAMKYVFRAAKNAGALGVFLSGSGSSVLALTHTRFMTIGYEMADAADKIGVTGNIIVASPTPKGAYIIRDE